MSDHLSSILDGLEDSRHKVQAEEGKRGQIGGASRHLAQQIVRLRDWAAEQPEELLPAEEITGKPAGKEGSR